MDRFREHAEALAAADSEWDHVPMTTPTSRLKPTWAAVLKREYAARTRDAVSLMTRPAEDPHDAIHETRRRIKHLRALWRLVRPVVAKATYRRQNIRLREAARRLAEDRDAYVGRQVLAKLDGRIRADKTRAHLRTVTDAWPVPRPDPAPTVFMSRNRQVARALRTSATAFADLDLPDEDRVFSQGLRKTYRAARLALAEASASGAAAAFHECRKHVKYLMYQMQSLSAVWPKELQTWIEDLDALQLRLGQLNDLDMVRGRVEAGPVHGLLKRRFRSRRSRVKDRGARLLAASPSTFTRRVVMALNRSGRPFRSPPG